MSCELTEVKFRFREGHRDFIIQSPWVLQNLFLNLTGACNLRCHYCHAHFNRTQTHMERDPRDILDQRDVRIASTGKAAPCHFEYAIVVPGWIPRRLTYGWFSQELVDSRWNVMLNPFRFPYNLILMRSRC